MTQFLKLYKCRRFVKNIESINFMCDNILRSSLFEECYDVFEEEVTNTLYLRGKAISKDFPKIKFAA